MVRGFASDSGDQASIPSQVQQTQKKKKKKKKKKYLMSLCLTQSIIRYKSRVSGAIQGKE